MLLPGIAAVGELDVREARDAQVVREMTARREWLTPILGRDPFFAKPVLGYAVDAFARRTLRGGAPATRAIKAALAALLAALVGALGARAFGGRAGVFSAIAFATMLGTPLAVRMDATALMAAALAWIGVSLLWRAVLDARSSALETGWGRTGRWLGWGALGLAGAVAGPLAALWPVAGVALYCALVHERRAWRALDPFAGALVIAGTMLPWYGAMTAFHGREFLARAPFFPYAENAWGGGPLFAITAFVVNGFPWAPLVAASVRDEAERLRAGRFLRNALSPRADVRATPADAGAAAVRDVTGAWAEHCASSLLLSLMIAALAPVAIWPTPPLTAALPALPAAAILCGHYVSRVWAEGAGASRLLAGATRMTAFIGTVLAVMLVVLSTRVLDATEALRHAGAGVFLAGWAPLLAELLGRRRLAAALFALPVAFGAPFATARVLPAMQAWFTTGDVADAMEASAPALAPLVVLEPPPPSLRLALGRNLVTDAAPFDRLAAYAARDGRAYVAFRPSQERVVARSAPAPIEILVRTPALVLARVRVSEAPPAPADTTRVIVVAPSH